MAATKSIQKKTATKNYVGISKKTPDALKQLKFTLRKCPHIEEVYFTQEGNHYFNKHDLPGAKKGDTKAYGHLNVAPVLYKVQGERKIYKMKSVDTPETEIVETLTREEVMEYELPADVVAHYEELAKAEKKKAVA